MYTRFNIFALIKKIHINIKVILLKSFLKRNKTSKFCAKIMLSKVLQREGRRIKKYSKYR
jgi:hypothetical protein